MTGWSVSAAVLFALFVAMVVAGLALGIWFLLRSVASRSGPQRILEARLARGEISSDEFRDRMESLGPRPWRGNWLVGLSIGLIVAGVIGASVTMAVGPGFMHMMGGGSMMGGGEPGRSGGAPVPGARAVQVAATEFRFDPPEIQMDAGATVNVVFRVDGGMFHTFTVQGLDFELRASPGQTVRGSVRADRASRYQFICAVAGHASLGMTGTIIVG